MRRISFLLLLNFLGLAEAPQIPPEVREAYWQAYAVLNSAQAAYQASLTDKQKQILSQIELLRRVAQQAEQKAAESCPSKLLDTDEQKKNVLACKTTAPPKSPPSP